MRLKTKEAKAKRLKRIRDDIRSLDAADAQRMIIELHLEGMRDENIANDLGTTGESVRKWGKGFQPSAPKVDLIRELHSQVMYLKEHGITVGELRAQKKTIAQAYADKKDEERAA